MSISWTMPSKPFWAPGPPIEVCEDQRRVPGRDEEFVKVGEVAVTGSHFGDPLVAVVVDVIGSAQAVALEPGEHRPALVGLGAEVGGHFPGRQGVEPDHLAGVADDLRAARIAAPLRGDEDIAVAITRTLRQHFDRRNVISSTGRRRVTCSYGPRRHRAAGRGSRGDGHADHDGGGAATIMAHALSFQVTIHQRIPAPAEPGSRGQPAVPAEAGTYGPQRQNVPARARRTAMTPPTADASLADRQHTNQCTGE